MWQFLFRRELHAPGSQSAHSTREGVNRLTKDGRMARRPNYGFEKKQREMRKAKKKQEKAERKAAEDAAALAAEGGGSDDETAPESD